MLQLSFYAWTLYLAAQETATLDLNVFDLFKMISLFFSYSKKNNFLFEAFFLYVKWF